MKEKHLQNISNLLDDELDSNLSTESIDLLNDDEKAGAKLDRYAMFGEALRDESIVVLEDDFLTKVQKALEDEPIVFSPAQVKKSKDKPYIGVTLAASFAFMSVLLFNLYPNSPSNDPMSPYAEGISTGESQIAFEDEPKNHELEEYLKAQQEQTGEQLHRLDTRLVGFEKE